MKYSNKFIDKKVLILGYALTGKSVADFLLSQGSQITINDRGDLSQDRSVDLLIEQGVKVVDQGHPLELLDQGFDYIIKNPGIPYSIDLIQAAIEKQIPIYTDIEIAAWINQANIIGITGSNGKTTTAQLTYNILNEDPTNTSFLAGNIGVPTLNIIPQAQAGDNIVIELSSFQLQGTQSLKPKIAVIVNIYEAHLDYHGSRENYIEAKLQLIKNQDNEDFLVYRHDQGELHGLVYSSNAAKVPFSAEIVDNYIEEYGTYVKEGKIYYRGQFIMNSSDVPLPGKHNLENVLAAISVAKILDIGNPLIVKTIEEFKGMPHRNQLVYESQGRKFYNDSKATNMTATITALASFKQPIVYIGGGLDRGNSFDELIPHLNHIKAAYLYGQSKEKMLEAFSQVKSIHELKLFDNLEEATRAAYKVADQGDIVLFSPACASWDQFKNFEIRGDHFVNYINQLGKDEPYV